MPAGPQPRFLNDVEVTRDGVFVTDSRNAQPVVVRRSPGGALPDDVERLPLTGEWVQTPGAGVNSANGIRALPGGDLLVVNRGGLHRVDPDSGRADRLPQTGGERLTAGDGLELRGSTLFVVYGFGRDSVAVVELGAGARSFAVVDELRKDEPDDADLERPTTATFAAGSLWVVNGKFASPGGPQQEVARLPLR